MIKKLLFLTFSYFLLFNPIFSQEFVPLTQTALETVKGDMRVIGNSILGIRGQFERVDFTPNEPYNGGRNNGTIFSFFSYTRAYIDIDSDPNFQDYFSASFKSINENHDYSDNNPDTIDVDENGSPLIFTPNGTFSSSASFLDIDNSCNKVVKAFLYWSATHPNETINSSNETSSPRNNFCGTNCEDYTEIKILPPGGDQYYNISIDPNATSNPNAVKLKSEVIIDGLEGSFYNTQLFGSEGLRIQDSPYVCKADITPLFESLQENNQSINGYWTVGNVKVTTGFRSLSGLAGGWTLAVIYETNDPSETTKSICFYDGFSNIQFEDTPVKVNIPSFKTLPTGDINAWIASASLEGDRGLGGDQFLIETETSKINFPGPDATAQHALPNSARPLMEINSADNTTNFFNSSITDLNGQSKKLPNSSNTLGYDTDHFPLINTDNRILNNGSLLGGGHTDTTASLYLATIQDSYSSFFTAFAIETPDEEAPITESQFIEICNGPDTLITAIGFDTYTWYFVPAPILDQNENGIIDDADFDISDATEIARFTSTASANANEFTVSEEGYYFVILEKEPTCANARQSFNVINGSQLIANPFEDSTLNPTRQDACSVDGEQITKFVFCNTDLTLNTNYSDGTTLVWERLEAGSCTRPDADMDCPFIGPDCNYTTLQTSIVDVDNLVTSQFTINETANYRLTVTEHSGCSNTFYFNTTKLASNLSITAPIKTICANDAALITINGLTPFGAGVDYELELLIQDPNNASTYILKETQVATDANYGIFTINRPSPFKEMLTIRIIATPNLSPTVDPTACTFVFENKILFNDTIEVNLDTTQPDDFLEEALVTINSTGGEMPYLYKALINETDKIISESDSPNFTFDDSYDGIEISFNVIDANGCEFNESLLFTPDFSSETLGVITKELNLDELKVYPNPSAQKIYFDLNVNQAELINLSGVLITTFENVSEIDVEQLNTGVYFIKLTKDQHTTTKRFVKK